MNVDACPGPSLGTLGSVRLTGRYAALLAEAERRACGDPVWVRRKLFELRAILALCQIAPYRLSMLNVEFDTEPLRLVVGLYCPVALRPVNGTGKLGRAPGAVLGINYPRSILLGPLPGTSFVEILQPAGVFLPTVNPTPPVVMCLGATIPRGMPITELLVLAYASLTMQVISTDRRDPFGVLCAEAARYFEKTRSDIPLTEDPFLRDPDSEPPAVDADGAAMPATPGELP